MDMDVITVEKYLEEASTVEEEELEDFDLSFEAGTEGEESGQAVVSVPSVTDDPYRMDIAVAVTETESEDVGKEFIEALSEIEGKKSFPCTKCSKVCKSKGGLTKHTNSKHCAETVSDQMTPLCKDTLASIVETIKTNLIEKNEYGSEMKSALETVSSSEDLLNVLLPLYQTFHRKKNIDRLLESFYGLIPQSCELLNCDDYRAANLIMIHIPDHLIGLYNTSQMRDRGETKTAEESTKIDPAERGPLSYIGGYVVSKLFQASKRKVGQKSVELQLLLQNMKCPNQANNFISARTRGGLVTPCEDLVGILQEAEILFRKETNKSSGTLRNIPTEIICYSTLRSPLVKSLWDNIVLSSGVSSSSSTKKLCLENVIKLYLKVRSFSFAKDFITKYKIKEGQTKKRALRKVMKQNSGENKQSNF